MGSDTALMTDTSLPKLQRADEPPIEPLRLLVLRGVDGTGGGADNIILRNAQGVDPNRIAMSLCFLRHAADREFDFDRRCQALRLDYHEVLHHGPFDFGVWRQLRAIAERIQPHLIHSHEYKANYYAARLGRRLRVPTLSTAHGWTGQSLRERWLYYPADKLLLSQFSGVLAVSNQIRETLLRFGARPERVRVLLNAIDPQQFRRDNSIRQRTRAGLGFSARDFVIGAVGRLERQKRFDLLLSAFAQLVPICPEARLIIAGNGSLLSSLKTDIERRRLHAHVRLLGHRSDMPDVYQAFDLLAQSSDYEGTPTVIVEAMALEIPIVATDVGGTSQLAEHQQHALLVPRRRPDLLCQAIRDTRQDVMATEQRVARARHRVETELSYATRVRKLEGIYRELVGESSGFRREKGERGA